MQTTSNTVGVVSMQRVTMGIYIIVPFFYIEELLPLPSLFSCRELPWVFTSLCLFLLYRATFTAAQFVSMQRVTMGVYIIVPFPFT
jgi:hypothetical protein